MKVPPGPAADSIAKDEDLQVSQHSSKPNVSSRLYPIYSILVIMGFPVESLI